MSEANELDLLLSFMEMKVPRNSKFVIQELVKNSFEYKIIETAFVTTSDGVIA